MPGEFQPKMRRFGDYAATRDAVFTNALSAVQALPAAENTRYRLSLSDVGYAPGWAPPTPADHKQALLSGRTLSRRMVGTFNLHDKATGQLVDRRRMTVASVPTLTDQGVFVLEGSGNPVSHQLRLLPGIYVRKKQSGEVAAHVNVAGRGVQHHVVLDPETGVFKTHIGQSELPTLTLLRLLGAKDAEVKALWGHELFAANNKADRPHHVDKYWEKMGPPGKAPDGTDKAAVLADRVSRYKLDPWVMKQTLGKAYETYGKQPLLDVTAKMLAVARGKAEPDDRDHLAFSRVFGPEHLISERVAKGAGLITSALWGVTNAGSLKRLPPNILTPAIKHLFTKSGLSGCFDPETKVLTVRGFVPWPEVKEDDLFACRVDGAVKFLPGRLHTYDHDGLMYGCRTAKLDYLVTADHRLYVAPGDTTRSTMRFETAEYAHNRCRRFECWLGTRAEADHIDPDVAIPAATGYKFQLQQPEISIPAVTWARFLGWYVAEGCVCPSRRKYNYTKKTARRSWASQQDALNTYVCQSHTAHPDNVRELRRLLDQLPFRFCYERRGHRFKASHRRLGEFLSDCGRGAANKRIPRYVFSWSDATLREFFTCFMAGDGSTYQRDNADLPDLKVEISSEGLAWDIAELSALIGFTPRIRCVPSRTKFCSKNQKTYTSRPTWVVTFGRNKTTMTVGSRRKSRLGKPSDYYTKFYSGKVYCATVPGGLLYVARGGRPHWSGNSVDGVSASEFIDHGARLTKLGEGGIGRSADSIPMSARDVGASQFPFIDLSRTSECFDDQTEVMTYAGWKRWTDVVAEDRLACLFDGELRFERPTTLHVYDYDGLMYGANNEAVNYLVTPNHRFYVAANYMPRKWRWTTAEGVHDSIVFHRTSGHSPYAGDAAFTEFHLPKVDATIPVLAGQSAIASRRTVGVRRVQNRETVPIGPFCELLGWYLGEGSVRDRVTRSGPQYAVVITQYMTVNPQKCERIRRCLEEIGLTFTYQPSTQAFMFCGKQWVKYFAQFGHSPERFIPEIIFSAPIHARRRLFEALLLAEGTTNKYDRVESFNTTSPQLAHDFVRLAFSLGYSTSMVVHPDNRKEYYLDNYRVTWHTREFRRVWKKRNKTKRKDSKSSEYYTTHYSGKVYCATVPGGMLYVRRAGCFGFWSGNSESVGADLRVAFGTRLGTDGRIYAPLLDRRSNRLVFRSPRDVAEKTVAFPGAMNQPDPVVPVVRNGKLTYAPRHEVDYVVPSMEQSFSPLANLIPFKGAMKAHRTSMGSRFIAQALPLAEPEAPLVQNQVPGQPGKSFAALYGRHMGAVFAAPDKAGVVQQVTPDVVTVRYADGTTSTHGLYNNVPVGRKAGLHTTPVVVPGQEVAPGQILARSNYTDANGVAAYGKNLRVAYMSDRGRVYEDAMTLSESAAKKLTSDHYYTHSLTPDPHTTLGKTAYVAGFPGRHTLDTLKGVGDDGVVKPGTIVRPNDPLILAVRRKPAAFGRLSRSGKAGISDASVLWEHDEPGVVTDVVHGSYGPNVVVRTQVPLKTGDKVSNLYGGKGIATVIPDHQMPVGEDGKPVEVIMSSLGLISRANPAQYYESLLGKLAARQGKPYVVSDFGDDGDPTPLIDRIEAEAARHGVRHKEDLTDPQTGNKIPGVATGISYLLKLHHIASAKVKGRGLGGYDESGQPLRGQSGKAMRASLGDTNALLSYGATNNIHDAHALRGQGNDLFWLGYMSGFPPMTPHVSSAFEHFLSELQAAGVNPVRKDGRYHLMALTDKDVNRLTGDRVVANGETLDFGRNGEPYPGGLFDTKTFGAVDSKTQWAKIQLPEPMVNPVMEDPARRLLGLTEKQFRETIAGRHHLATGTGPKAIADALAGIDVQKELARTRQQAASSRKTVRDEANRRLIYLKGLEKTGQNPKDWVLSAVPVLPPAFRPVSAGSGGRDNVISHDSNFLYSELIQAIQAHKELAPHVADTGDEKLNVYDAMKAVVGLGDPVGAKNQERGVKGVLARLLGESSKSSYMQQRLLGTPTNLSGRAQALPNPDLNMDEVGIPESMAWEIYHPFIVRRLVQRGMGRVDAARAVADQSKMAREAMVDEMGVRPVLMTRYPVLHRFGVQAQWPKLMAGDGLHINPMVTRMFNGDFDGDSYTVQVPLSDAAVKEAQEKLLPSKNLFTPTRFDSLGFTHGMEFLQGLHYLSTADAGNPPVEFRTRAEALRAYRSGKIGADTKVRILEE